MTSGYSLAMGMIMPLTAFLITRFPTKRLYLTGIAGFIIGLLLSIFAGNFGMMMVGRIRCVEETVYGILQCQR